MHDARMVETSQLASLRSELAGAAGSLRAGLLGVAAISAALNVLALTGSFFMLLVYDRAIPSRSGATLLGLTVLAAVLYGFQIALDVIRSRLFIRLGAAVNMTLSARVYDVILQVARLSGRGRDAGQPMRDLDQLRSFLAGGGPAALMDLPWMALYLAICFAFHVLIGTVALLGALVLIALTALTEFLSRTPSRRIAELAVARNTSLSSAQQSADAIAAHGMAGRLATSWDVLEARYLAAQQEAADVTGGLSSATRVLRLFIQSLVLAAGAYLVINDRATGGIVVAGSILAARALAPVELAIANWRGLVAARQSGLRLSRLLEAFPRAAERLALPPPRASLDVEAVTVTPPGAARPALAQVSFSLKAGQALGVIGPSGGGKSTLAQALAGVWRPVEGQVKLDGAALELWRSDLLGANLGYLPQDVQLLAGTVAQNIARFQPDPPPDAVVAAARAAGVHDLIAGLPNGYETQIGAGGQGLSGGERQRLGLARALYGDPFLIILDEPNSNLDAAGDVALTEAIVAATGRGGIVVVVAHRPGALTGVDQILFLEAGRARAFGPKDEVLAMIMRATAQQEAAARMAPS